MGALSDFVGVLENSTMSSLVGALRNWMLLLIWWVSRVIGWGALREFALRMWVLL